MPAKSGNDRFIFIAFGVAFLILLAVILFLLFNRKKCPEGLSFDISPGEVIAGSNVVFTPSIQNAKSWDWDFGDNTPHVYTAVATHIYKTKGKYDLELKVNGKSCNCSHPVEVKQAVVADIPAPMPAPLIAGPNPAVVYVGRKVKFSSPTDAKKWEWFFDHGNEQRQGREVTYTFTEAGEQTVQLVTDDNSIPANFKIKVRNNVPPPYNSPTPPPAPVQKPPAPAPPPRQNSNKPLLTEEKLKVMCDKLHNRMIDIQDFSQYFCEGLSQKVSVNGTEEEFGSFLKDVRATVGKLPDMSATIEPDPVHPACIGNIIIHWEQ